MEILTFNTDSAPDVIECTDGSTDCVINCNKHRSGESKQMQCHLTSETSIYKINLIGQISAENAFIYIHKSPSVEMKLKALMAVLIVKYMHMSKLVPSCISMHQVLQECRIHHYILLLVKVGKIYQRFSDCV